MFKKATKEQSRLRLALIGPSGSGKTYTALTIATAFGGPIAVIDTERGSASKYADLFAFDTVNMETFAPQTYVEAIRAAAQAGYKVLVIDSLSHAWVGREGSLEQHDKAMARQRGGNSFAAWREVTPHHNALVDAILQADLHIIGTMRAKTEYVQEKDERTGKTTVRKVGMAPVQRDGLEYEFDVVADMDADHTMIVSKSRCRELADAVIRKPGAEVAQTLAAWLGQGVAPAPAPKPEVKPEQPPLSEHINPVFEECRQVCKHYQVPEKAFKGAVRECLGKHKSTADFDPRMRDWCYSVLLTGRQLLNHLLTIGVQLETEGLMEKDELGDSISDAIADNEMPSNPEEWSEKDKAYLLSVVRDLEAVARGAVAEKVEA